MFRTGGLQFAGRTNPMEVTVKPDFQQQAWRVGRTTFHGGGRRKTQRGQFKLFDKLADKAGRMVGGHPIFQGRWKKKLLAVIGTYRFCHSSQTSTTPFHSKSFPGFETVSAATPPTRKSAAGILPADLTLP